MNIGYLYSAYAVSFESGLIDESSCRVSRRVAEEGATGESPWLLSGTKGSGIGGIIGNKVYSEYCINKKPFGFFFEDRVTIREVEFAVFENPAFIRFHIENGCGEKRIFDLESEASGISRYRAADSARESYPLPEEGILPCFRYLEREGGYKLSSHRSHRILAPLRSFQGIADDNPLEHLKRK